MDQRRADMNSRYAKPFLTIPEQTRRLRERGMDCGTDREAAHILERHGYYRLSGYWYPFREQPVPPAPRRDRQGREIRLNSFEPGTSLAHVAALCEFDQELRSRLQDVLGITEVALRFYIGHRLGRIDAFAHRKPELLGATRPASAPPLRRLCHLLRRGPYPTHVPTAFYREWLDEYDRSERRARDNFVVHFRSKYGPHLPIWVATEVMSFGVLSNLYRLMPQPDQEILASRFQVLAADGRGDRGAFSNWLNVLRHTRNICAHHGRLWNRTFDVLVDAPGRSRADPAHHLRALAQGGAHNKLYGVLLVLRHLMLSISPEHPGMLDLVDLVVSRSGVLGFSLSQLGFPDEWRQNPIWNRSAVLDDTPMLAANLLDRVHTLTAPQVRELLTAAEPRPVDQPRTPSQLAAARRGAQKELLRTYRNFHVIIEITLGGTRYYPAFQFRDGAIIDALAEINLSLWRSMGSVSSVRVAAAQLEWWDTPQPCLAPVASASPRAPRDLLESLSEHDFIDLIRTTGAYRSGDDPLS